MKIEKLLGGSHFLQSSQWQREQLVTESLPFVTINRRLQVNKLLLKIEMKKGIMYKVNPE